VPNIQTIKKLELRSEPLDMDSTHPQHIVHGSAAVTSWKSLTDESKAIYEVI
jgi:hypothetical protein